MMQRRAFLKSTLALSTAPAISCLHANAAGASPTEGAGIKPADTATAFGYAALKGRARAMAQQAYRPPTVLAPDVLRNLDYDQYQAIRYRRDKALWAQDRRGFRLEFFHLGRGFIEPVRMYEVIDGRAREIRYRPDLFDLSRSSIDARKLTANLAFAGFRIHAVTNWDADIAAFLGASYFRGVGSDTRQFGLSARGLAIDTGKEVEEFPRFVAWWFERPPAHARTMVFYGLLDSPSASGAYRFALTPGAPTTVEVDAALYPRKAIDRLGIAPLTSMYQCGENDRRAAYDWRPEIHDSDGLAIWNGNGEWIWRPLTNPLGPRITSYLDDNPRGFGLLQRDRNFSSYQDDGVFYERRPSLWIEPKSAWGKGVVQLVELNAPDETYDNIVAYWNPAARPKPGEELLYSYRMYWGTQMPANPPLGQVIATRTGLGGVVGRRREYFSWRFAVDFAGGELSALAERAKVEPVITVSRGTVEITSARPLAAGPIKGYRAMFDLRPPEHSTEPIDIRMFLRYENQPLTETWVYLWTPPPAAERSQALLLSGSGA